TILWVELEYRKQLYRRDAELLEIRYLLDQAGVRAALRFVHAGTRVLREAANVHLVDDGPRGRPKEWRVALPVIHSRIDDDALPSGRAVVVFSGGGTAA